ncbi:GMC oxidoreductase [Mycena galericulata]|nr:GMC oxidoreductase [Mycena galericulata]
MFLPLDSMFSGSIAASKLDLAGDWITAHPYEVLLGLTLALGLSRYLGVYRSRKEEHLAQRLEPDSEYDVIIVGGGTAGCVLASRLSEDLTISVCLVEAGESSLSVPHSRIPCAYSKLFGSDRVFNFETTDQSNAFGTTRYWPRGKMLGGCSALNAQIFHCGAPSDYDEWVSTGLEGSGEWSYQNLRKYFLRFEKFASSTEHPAVDNTLRGLSGPVTTGFFSYCSSFTPKFISACFGAGIPSRADFNTPAGTLGAGKFMTYIDAKGCRVTTESAYLTPQVLKRKNLHILTNTTVTRLVLDTAPVGNRDVRVTAVEVSPGKGLSLLQIKARSEIVLCAGAIHTPQIMMLSGLGPAEQLAAHGISTVVDLPGVGAHLLDHPVVDVVLEETSGASMGYLEPRDLKQLFKSLFAAAQYFTTGRGPLTNNWVESAAFFRSTDSALFPAVEYPQIIEDTTSGPDAPDLELLLSTNGYLNQTRTVIPNVPTLGLHVVLLRPQSLGTVTLRSADPFEAPVIDPNYLSSDNDVQILLRGLHMLNRIAHTAPLADILVHANRMPFFGHYLAGVSDAGRIEYIRAHLESLFHPTSTARMARRAAGGVVDAQLRVYGVGNLRIADASMFPSIPAGHTAAPTMAVAEKAADMIRAAKYARGRR